MSFQLSRDDEESERPTAMVWDGTAKRAHEIVDWARDEALLLFAQATAPVPGARPGTPEAAWRVQVRIPVPATMAAGGGDVWMPVEVGDTISNAGTWIDPVFKIVPSPKRQAAAAFTPPVDHPV